MKTSSFLRMTLGLMVAAACFGVAPALSAPPDPWITTKIKMALLADATAPGLPVNVDTNDGIVTLHGKVETAAQREAAVRVARSIDGVREVRNLLQVVPDKRRSSVNSTDDRVRSQVDHALDRDPALRDSRIRIASVNNGVVLLAGSARSMSDHLRALQVAGRVPGVRRVMSEIDNPDRLAENWDDERRNPPSGSNDGWITARTKMKFMTDPDVPASSINVDTDNGRVTLFGVVPSAAVRGKAERLARQTSGVRGVNNQLRVVPRSEQKMVRKMDKDVEAAAQARVNGLDLHGERVKVHVQGGVARLTGTVMRPADRFQVLTVTRNTDGVRAVTDQIRVDASAAARYY